MIEIEWNKEKWQFKTDLTLSEFFTIQEDFGQATGIVNELWWYNPSDFGKFFLTQAGNIVFINIIEPTDWKLFYPVFEHYFPTKKEYAILVKNVRFIKNLDDGVVENRYFFKYLFLRDFGNINNKEIDNLPLKEGLMLYYYIMGGIIIDFGTSLIKEPAEDAEKMTS